MNDADYQTYLHKVYQPLVITQSRDDSVSNPEKLSGDLDQTLALRQLGICSTYGELLYPSVKKLIRRMNLSNKDVFCDLGSGLGKCALQVFMQTDVKRVIGIEANDNLEKKAEIALENVQRDFPFFWENNRQIHMIAGNFLTHSWDSPTVVYTCSTCFDQPLLSAIGDRINAEPSLQQVLSLRPLPSLIGFTLKDVFRVECSWDSALCYHYRR